MVLGVVQGLTEFLPISSTAHLKVVPVLLGWGDPGVAVTAVIQLGSILAVIAYFRSDLSQVFKGIARALRGGDWGHKDARLGVAIALGTVPIVLAGLAIKLFWPGYGASPLRSLASIGIVSIVMALLLALAERIGQRRLQLPGVKPGDGLVVGRMGLGEGNGGLLLVLLFVLILLACCVYELCCLFNTSSLPLLTY